MVYLDYCATAPLKYPSSKYDAWLNANTPYAISSRKSLEYATELVKKAIGVKSGKIMFGGCASEIVDRIYQQHYEEWWTGSPYEHDCIYKHLDEVETNIAVLIDWGTDYTIYCHQLVNNVTGTIFDLKPYSDWAKESEDRIFLCDLTASIGKVKIPDLEKLGVDIAFWSGHKLGTEKNLGCAWFSDKAIKWLGEDFKLQEGTPNVEGAVAVAEATWDAVKCVKNATRSWDDMADYLDKTMREKRLGGVARGADDVRTNAILPVYFIGNADTLQMYLASKGVYVGLGASACAEKHDYRILNEFGLSDTDAEHMIRVSFGRETTMEDIYELIDGMEKFMQMFM